MVRRGGPPPTGCGRTLAQRNCRGPNHQQHGRESFAHDKKVTAKDEECKPLSSTGTYSKSYAAPDVLCTLLKTSNRTRFLFRVRGPAPARAPSLTLCMSGHDGITFDRLVACRRSMSRWLGYRGVVAIGTTTVTRTTYTALSGGPPGHRLVAVQALALGLSATPNHQEHTGEQSQRTHSRSRINLRDVAANRGGDRGRTLAQCNCRGPNHQQHGRESLTHDKKITGEDEECKPPLIRYVL